MLPIIIALLSLATLTSADHVVFVHGLAGFGPEELFGLGYWGFTGIFGDSQDYFKPFRNQGFTVHEASVGPVSSNHDRACELYAQIKGTKVDYGKNHAAQYDHERYGVDYTNKGFYPAWSGRNKIHLVGHSMGGNTIRYLEYLLQKGLSSETGSDRSILFKSGTQKSGGGNWIQSMTTIATPHDGSPLTAVLGTGFLEIIKDLLGAFAGVAMLTGDDPEWGFDFDLGHFGLNRNRGESFGAYKDRVMSSSIFNNGFKDLASWDLTPEWSREFNAKTELTYAGTFYFSIATVHTHACWNVFGWDQCPDLDMDPLMGVTGWIMGNLDGVKDSQNYRFSNSWEANDGVVPLRSSRSPQVGVRNYRAPTYWDMEGSWVKGRWYSMDVRRDHLQIIGFRFNPLEPNAADGIYDGIASTLNTIKAGSSVEMTATTDGVPDAVEGGDDVDNAAVIVGSTVGGLACVVLLAVVVIRRRSGQDHEQSAIRIMSGSWASPMMSPKARKKVSEPTESVAAQSVESENPVFKVEAAGKGPDVV
jgi:triacylglycerol lipase